MLEIVALVLGVPAVLLLTLLALGRLEATLIMSPERVEHHPADPAPDRTSAS